MAIEKMNTGVLARELGITPQALGKRMGKLGIRSQRSAEDGTQFEVTQAEADRLRVAGRSADIVLATGPVADPDGASRMVVRGDDRAQVEPPRQPVDEADSLGTAASAVTAKVTAYREAIDASRREYIEAQSNDLVELVQGTPDAVVAEFHRKAGQVPVSADIFRCRGKAAGAALFGTAS
jgi:hypothetical protein